MLSDFVKFGLKKNEIQIWIEMNGQTVILSIHPAYLENYIHTWCKPSVVAFLLDHYVIDNIFMIYHDNV